jgi:hypothetical protein
LLTRLRHPPSRNCHCERALWDETSTRDFAIGVEAGSIASSFELALTPDTLRLAAEVGARVVFVVDVHEPAGVAST